ncbi:MAG: hypothetical protein P9L92_09210 [Candidatus Electryonea clarkiae]|nr:hypothetical protein [Candidatus Electryonea clarkiae]MDP8285357.1 hypothetical protein [Candidatus Electryonea clarkiae]
MSSWGNQADNQYDQDMVTTNRRLLVTKNSNGTTVAITNTDGGAQARALDVQGDVKVSGDVDFDGRTEATWDANVDPTMKLTNTTEEMGGVALDATGIAKVTHNKNEAATHFTNTDTNSNARALKVTGRSEFDDRIECDNDSGTNPTGKFTNHHYATLGPALDVYGSVDIDGTIDINADADSTTPACYLKNLGETALRVDDLTDLNGPVDIDDIVTIDYDHATIPACRIANELGPALELLGLTHLDGAVNIEGATEIDGALTVDGATNLGGNLTMNSNELVLDNSAALGSGIKYNVNGPNNEPCIEFYVGGTRMGYLDSTGWQKG